MSGLKRICNHESKILSKKGWEFTMKNIYGYDNCEGDKGVIIADTMDEAIIIYKNKYPERNIANNIDEYWDGGCFLIEIGVLANKSELYVNCPW